MKKIFFLLIIAYQALFYTNLLQASCNRSNDPNVFSIYGIKEKKVVIEGDCLNELLKAMGEGKDIDIDYAEIKGDIDFAKSKFFFAHSFNQIKKDLSPTDITHLSRVKEATSSEIKIVLVKSHIKITNSNVVGNIIAYHPIMGGKVINALIFYNAVDFSDTTFNGTVNFRYTEFAGEAEFSKADIYGEADFTVATFARNANFVFTKFHKKAFFNNTDFVEKAFFMNAIFSKECYFMNAHFDGEAQFCLTHFFGNAIFSNTEYGGIADFWLSHFAKRVVFESTKFVDCSFNSTMFGIKSAYTKQYIKCENLMEKIAKEINVDIAIIKSSKCKIVKEKGKYFVDFQRKDIGRRPLSLRIVNLTRVMQAYSIAIDKEKPEEESAKDLLPEKEIESDFSDATFSKFADFRNALFLSDVNFEEARFKEVGLFDGCFFFNAKELGLIVENNPDSLVDLKMDNAYFNLLKGMSFDQLFPHLHKRLKYGKNEDEQKRKIRDILIENYIYLQENFRKIGRFEDADKIYYERRVLEAENETSLWNQTWNWILDATCKYGTDFRRIAYICLWIIIIFTFLYSLTIIPCVKNHLGTIEIGIK